MEDWRCLLPLGDKDFARVGRPISSVEDVIYTIAECYSACRGVDEEPLSSHVQLPALTTALDEWQAMHGDEVPVILLLQDVVAAAQNIGDYFDCDDPLPTLRQGRSGSVTLSSSAVHSLLCNMFLCNLRRFPLPLLPEEAPRPRRTLPHFGSVSMMLVYKSSGRVAVQRLLCLLAYFHQFRLQDDRDKLRSVSFERVFRGTPLDWARSTDSLCQVEFRSEGIETCYDCASHVDFANEDLHVGAIWPSATQEEIIFSVRPELFVGILFCETMLDNEAILIHNSLQYSTCKGFTTSFKFTGLFEEEQKGVTVIAMDAAMVESLSDSAEQLALNSISRELHKSWTGFSAAPRGKISTGNWGCGSFGGDPVLKFLIQWMSASAAGRQLVYCCPGTGFEQQHRAWTRVLFKHNSVAELYQVVSVSQDFRSFLEQLMLAADSGE